MHGRCGDTLTQPERLVIESGMSGGSLHVQATKRMFAFAVAPGGRFDGQLKELVMA